ncbi:hypothetical protein, partial [Pseudomonas aeruginosa]
NNPTIDCDSVKKESYRSFVALSGAMQSLSNNRRGLAKPRFEPRIAWSQQTFVRITPGGSPMTESTAGAGVHGTASGQAGESPAARRERSPVTDRR